jgi:hypothetical protein
MTTVRPFTMNDLLKFNNINLDYVSDVLLRARGYSVQML